MILPGNSGDRTDSNNEKTNDMKIDIKRFIIPGCAALLLAACDVKDPIYNTPHPEMGKITLTTDWTQRGAGIDIPASYTVSMGDYSGTVSGATHTIDRLFDPGTYRAHIYNTPQNITVSGTTASVSGGTVPAAQTSTFVNDAPGWLFTCALDVKIEKDKGQAFTAKMQQQVRQLTLVIEPKGGTMEKVASVTGVLSGVAGTLNIENGEHGTPSNVALTFTKDASDGNWKATVRLLGVTGAQQKLTGTIKFTGGSLVDLPLASDLTADLSAFNTDKRNPFALGGKVVETPTGAGFTATINGWTPVEGDPVVAD